MHVTGTLSRVVPFSGVVVVVGNGNGLLSTITDNSTVAYSSLTLLLLEFVSAGFFGLLIFLLFNVVNLTPQELDNWEAGDTLITLRIAFGAVLFPTTWSTLMAMTVALRQACINQHGSAEGDPNTTGSLFRIDRTMLCILAQIVLTEALLFFTWFLSLGNRRENTLVGLVLWGYMLFFFFPAAARRWNFAGGLPLMAFLRRTAAMGVPLYIVPRSFFPYAIAALSPDTLMSLYPLFLSFLEYLAVSLLFSDRVCAPYSREFISHLARASVALLESSRIGMLVVVTNSPAGSFRGLVYASVVRVISEALARNNLFSISLRATKYGFRRLWFKLSHIAHSHDDHEKARQPPPPIPDFNRIRTFKRVYLGVKVDTEYWGGLDQNFGVVLRRA